MSQWDAWYPPHITAPVALSLHEHEYGPAWPLYEYTATPYPDWPLEPIFMHVRMEFMADVYRMVVSYEFGSPPTNMAVTTHDWAWISEDPIASNSYEAVEAKYDAYFAAIAGVITTGVRVTGYRWAKWRSDFSKPDPSLRFATRNISFTGSGGALPPQVACAVTEETDIRRRWGRFYLPFLTAAIISNGRISNATCTLLANSTKDLLDTIEGTWQHVTVSTLEPNVLATRFVRVDNTPDVIRSRRWPSSSFRAREAVT